MLVFPSAEFYNVPGDSRSIWNLLHKRKDDEWRFLYNDLPWCISGPVWRRSFYNKIGGFNEKARSWQDWDIHLRALSYNPKVFKVEDKWTNVHHFFRNNQRRESISTIKTLARELNRIEVYESVRKSYHSQRWERAFLTRYYLAFLGTRKNNEVLASHYLKLRSTFALRYRILWHLNFFIWKMIKSEQKGVRGMNVSSITKRVYLSRIFSPIRLFMPKSTICKIAM